MPTKVLDNIITQFITAYIAIKRAQHRTYSLSIKAPNQLRLVVDRPPREEVARFQRARNAQVLHRSAAKLWSHGVEMNTALKILREAVAESAG